MPVPTETQLHFLLSLMPEGATTTLTIAGRERVTHEIGGAFRDMVRDLIACRAVTEALAEYVQIHDRDEDKDNAAVADELKTAQEAVYARLREYGKFRLEMGEGCTLDIAGADHG